MANKYTPRLSSTYTLTSRRGNDCLPSNLWSALGRLTLTYQSVPSAQQPAATMGVDRGHQHHPRSWRHNDGNDSHHQCRQQHDDDDAWQPMLLGNRRRRRRRRHRRLPTTTIPSLQHIDIDQPTTTATNATATAPLRHDNDEGWSPLHPHRPPPSPCRR